MSNTPIQDPPARPLSSSSGHSLPSRPLQPISDPSASKRVCFYKNGDHKFSGHRMVINTRTFKTFDALLDVLSKKVPLAFGVRTITTPRGSHLVKALDDLHDGGSYVCSDHKRVKPLNLDEVTRRQVPWNTTRPLSNGQRRRQGPQFGPFGRRNEVTTTRPVKVTERVAVRTPKRLVVIRNKDPTVKRTIVLQKRIAPTFDALLDYLSQILQFPVLKLFSTDGRRVDGLAGLILCSGVVVAAGNEPFRLGNYSFQGAGQIAQVMHMDTVEPSMWQPRTQNNKPLSSGRGSRNFSVSSERYIVNQINKSRNGNTNGHPHHHSRSFEPEVNHRHTSLETRGTGRVDDEHRTCLVPQDDDIEKSFRVNQDGSMTVEMKVRLTIKEEEMLHWTTTLSRSSLSKGTVCASITELGNSSPDSNNAIAKDSSSASEDETKEENHPARAGNGVNFMNEQEYAGYASTALGKAKSGFKRTPTPGPRHVSKKASVESVKMVTESGVHENTLGHYSYMERTADGETTEGYCVVRHSSGSSNRPIPKPRKTASAGASNKDSHSSIRLSGAAEVLQIQNNVMDVTETVMHIYETQGCYDNYFANEEYSTDGVTLHGSTPVLESKPSTDGRCSSSNDCDFSWEPPATDSLQTQKEEMLSLSSEPMMPTHESTATNSQIKVKKSKSETKRKIIKPAQNQTTSSSDKKQKESIASTNKNSKHSSTDKLSSNTSVGKKTLSSSESGQKRRGAEKPQITKAREDEKTVRKKPGLLVDTANVRRTPPKRQNLIKAARDNGHNVDTPTGRPQMKKNMSDILQHKKSLLPAKKTTNKPKSMSEDRIPSPKKSLELSGNSMPSLNPSPSEIHQYVENWLDKVSPDPVPYAEDAIADVTEPSTNVVFQIGGGSESDEKSDCRTPLHELCPSAKDAVKKSASCLSVPHEATALPHNEDLRGSCVSMPSVRVDAVHHENRLRLHKSTEAICPAYNEPYPSNVLDPKVHTKHVLRELYSSIHCITSESETNTTANLEKSSSLPDFSTQVASVFGSSYKAFISFLSVMTLRDNLSGSAAGGGNQSRSTSEAMLMIESLQKISAIEDEEELRASLTDLQSRTSSQLRERWKAFQILRERLESEPLSPKVSETEFALDVFSEGGDAFEEIDELMDELNMPPDLRAEISATIQQAKSFYPVEESTFVENERNQSDSEEDVEQFAEECNNDTKQSPETDTTSTAEDISQTLQSQSNGERDNLQKMQSGQAKMMNESELEYAKVSEMSQTKRNETDRREDEQVEEAQEVETDRDRYTKKIHAHCDGKETEKGGREEEAEERAVTEVDYKEQEESVNGIVEEEESVRETEEEMMEDEEEERKKLEGAEEILVDDEGQEARNDDSVEDADEKESVEEMKGGQDEVDDEEKEEQCKTEEKQGEETEEEADGVIEESEGEHFIEEVEEEEEDDNVDEIIGETDEGEEEGHIKEKEEEEEADAFNKYVEEKGTEVIEEENNETDGIKEVIEKKCEEGDVENVIEEMEEEEEEEETDTIPEKDEEKVVVEETDEEDEENIVEEKEKEDNEVISEENNYEEDDEEEEVVEDGEVINAEEEQEGEGTDKSIEEEEKCDEGERSRNKMEETVNSLEEESEEEKEVVEETDKNIKAGQMLHEEEREEDEESERNEQLDEVQERKPKDEAEEENATDDECSIQGGTDCKNTLEEASYLEQQNSHDEANVDAKVAEYNSESSTKYSSECPCEDDKGNGTDTVNELETDEGGEPPKEGRSSLEHPVEISQELLDFVNSALQSSSLIFTYDARGNVRIEPESARVTQTKQIVIPKSRKDISYGLKRLPSPSTSDLSDYRPETSQSGGYKTQESVDIITDSGEETDMCKGRTSVEGVNSKLSFASNREDMESSRLKSGRSSFSHDSGTKASKEDLSYFSAASSQKADAEPATEATQCTSSAPDKDSDGVLIDQGRWLLKENHLIRKSPPVSLGMYGHLDSTSIDTGQENTSEDSQSPCKSQRNPLAAISSSELEEMAKPQTPKCAYYNMAHGSDSDPFMDDSSFKSGTKDASSVKGRGVRVSPTIDTSKTWANKNGSLSSFASVEFKIPDGKVHPEGDSSSVTRTRRTSHGGRQELQAQDSQDNLHVRCGQYCPIL